MNILKTKIEGVVILEPVVFGDRRGYFFESFSRRRFEEAVGVVDFVQDNESRSSHGVVRGLHFQLGEQAQAKLVRVVEGCVLDVAVDVRRGSPTFGQHVAVELSGENHRQLFIPRGFAHGFAVLSQTALFQYKCDNYYAPQAEGGIAWDDPALGIDWRIPREEILLSEKASIASTIHSVDVPVIYGYNIIKEGPYSLAVFGGPKVRYIWDRKSDIDFENFDQVNIRERLRPLNLSFPVGVSVTISRVFFDFRYDMGLHNISKSVTYDIPADNNAADENTKNEIRFHRRDNVLSFSFGVFF